MGGLRIQAIVLAGVLVVTGLVAGPAMAQESPAMAQEGQRDWAFWASGGIGLATPYEIGVAASGAAHYQRAVLRARYSTAAEFLGNSTEDFGLLVGFVLTPPTSRGQAVVGAGVGRVSGVRGCVLCGSEDVPSTTGFFMDLEGRYPLTTFLGLSGYAFSNFNSRESFGGVALGVYLGQV